MKSSSFSNHVLQTECAHIVNQLRIIVNLNELNIRINGFMHNERGAKQNRSAKAAKKTATTT